MKALLDTHIWIWYLIGDSKLRKSHRKLISNPESEIWLSSMSIWEAHLLIERERLEVNEKPAKWIRTALQSLRVREAPMTFSIALRARSLSLEHQDPADRFIAATSLELGIPLLTNDDRLLRCKELRCQ
jgi:PIN domain nuclease of toxin-antitoxin system